MIKSGMSIEKNGDIVFYENGVKTLSFEDNDHLPLGLDDLNRCVRSKKLNVDIRFNSQCVFDLNNDPVGLKLKLNERISTFALVEGGWKIPGPFVGWDTVYLLDRCSLQHLKRKTPTSKLLRWSEYLNEFELLVSITPMIFEGVLRSRQTKDDIIKDIKETTESIKNSFPNVCFVFNEEETLSQVISLINQFGICIENEKKFLCSVNNFLRKTPSSNDHEDLFRLLNNLSISYGIPKKSLTYLSCASAILGNTNKNYAKNLLKFKPAFSMGDAHNGLHDLKSLEILINSILLHPEIKYCFLTDDLNLSLYWCVYQECMYHLRENGVIKGYTTFPNKLFYKAKDEIDMERLISLQ